MPASPALIETANERAAVLCRAEEQAWGYLARAVDTKLDFVTRRREAQMAASLFACVAAIVGQPTYTPPDQEAAPDAGQPIVAKPDIDPTKENPDERPNEQP